MKIAEQIPIFIVFFFFLHSKMKETASQKMYCVSDIMKINVKGSKSGSGDKPQLY